MQSFAFKSEFNINNCYNNLRGCPDIVSLEAVKMIKKIIIFFVLMLLLFVINIFIMDAIGLEWLPYIFTNAYFLYFWSFFDIIYLVLVFAYLIR
jgi:hypothetical protein